MKFLRTILAVLCLAFASAAHAQFSAYATANYTRFGFSGGNYNGVAFKGGGGGIALGTFYTLRSSSRLKAGIDVRYLYSPGYHGGDAFNAALRVVFVPNQNRLRPYFQIGGGVVHTQLSQVVCNGFSCASSYQGINNGALNLDFGLDVRITPTVDWRAFDWGAAAGTSNAGTHADVGWFGTGVVYHFGKIARPKP